MLFTSCRSALFFLGPWVPSLDVSSPALFSGPSRRSEPWLHDDHPSRCSGSGTSFTLFSIWIILHVVLDLIILHVVLGLLLGTFSACLVLSPCSFTLLVVLGASSNDFHVLRVVWWSPAPLLLLPSTCCACRVCSTLPRASVGSRSSSRTVILCHSMVVTVGPRAPLMRYSSFVSPSAPCVKLFSMGCVFLLHCCAVAIHTMQLSSASTGLQCEGSYESLTCGADFQLRCFEASLPLLPGSLRAPLTSEPSRSLECSEASVLPLPRSCVCSCVCWTLPLWSCSSFAAVFLEPSYSLSLCTNLFWTFRCRLEHLHPSLLLLGHTMAPLRTCVHTALRISSAASSRCSRISPSRGLVEGLVAPASCVFRAALSLPLRYCDCFRHHLLSRCLHRESVLRTSLAHLAVGVLTCRLARATQALCHL